MCYNIRDGERLERLISVPKTEWAGASRADRDRFENWFRAAFETEWTEPNEQN